MSKMMKSKKEKIPKLTEEEYAQYISSLKISDCAPTSRDEEEKMASKDAVAEKEERK